MPASTLAPAISDRQALIDWFGRTRERSRQLFDMVTPEAYYVRPIPLRHPIVFYEGHLAAFSLNTLVKRALGQPGVDAGLEQLFARGIDPERAEDAAAPSAWPAREQVRTFVDEVDRRVRQALAEAPIDQPGHALLEGGQAVYTIIEHEAMHQETLLYMWHELPYTQKRAPAPPADAGPAAPPPEETVAIPAGRATLGAARDDATFGWDNEFEATTVDVPAFTIDRYNVTNAAFLEFVDAGGYQDERWWSPATFAWLRTEGIEHPRFWTRHDGQWRWRGLFDAVPLPLAGPVYVSQCEAAAYARWRGRRLPTEAELHRAGYGTPEGRERPFPWGDDPPAPEHGHFDFAGWDPRPVGSHPAGRSAWGVDDLLGNGWEWTETAFTPFDGFTPLPSYPEYSADFFDQQHYVVKGASPVTARELLRRSFRNWFRPHYPYVYATFRSVAEAGR